MSKGRPVVPTTAAEIAAIASDLQVERVKAEQSPLTGVEIAEQVGGLQPDPAPKGARYRLASHDAPHVTFDVVSPDGTVEDAIRVFNHGRDNVRTAKQLRIEKLSD